MSTPSTTRYDRYGRPAGYLNPIEGAPEPYRIMQADATTMYIWYYETGEAPTAIRRIVTLDDATQICVGWGATADAATIDYYPINSVFTVNDEDGSLVSVSPYDTPVDPITAD